MINCAALAAVLKTPCSEHRTIALEQVRRNIGIFLQQTIPAHGTFHSTFTYSRLSAILHRILFSCCYSLYGAFGVLGVLGFCTYENDGMISLMDIIAF